MALHDEDDIQSGVSALIKEVRNNSVAGPRYPEASEAHRPGIVLLPEGWTVEPLDPPEFLPILERSYEFADTPSIARYASEWEDVRRWPEARIWSVLKRPKPGAPLVGNDSPAGFLVVPDAASDAGITWGLHRAQCHLAWSEPLKEWTKKLGSPLDQLALAKFLRDREGDIADGPEGSEGPNAPELREMVEKFRMTRNVQFGNIVDLAGGVSDLVYVTRDTRTSHESNQTLRAYDFFHIAIPVFDGSSAPLWRMRVNLQMELDHTNHKLLLTLDIPLLREAILRAFAGEERAFMSAFNDACALWPPAAPTIDPEKPPMMTYINRLADWPQN